MNLEISHWSKEEVSRRIGVSWTAVWKYMKKMLDNLTHSTQDFFEHILII
jgi:hypothetical protein